MQKPKNTIYGVRVLYLSVAILAIVIGSLVFDKSMIGSVVDMVCLFFIPIGGLFYLIYLLSKGKFWVRSVLLAGTIISGIKVILGIAGIDGIMGISLWLMNVLALYFLYRKDSNTWFANNLMQENLKLIEKQRKR